MEREFTAQMSTYRGRWRLYVVLMNTTERWPEYGFDRALPVPTLTERTDALGVLGFEPVPGAAWQWTECSQDPDDPASPVVLIAAIRVRSWAGVPA
ncbi:DUF6303 family protein [Streptomyces sp. NRRL B-3648]|uniref:DUF6303 family protein n=1 Tax=Streptomyces sp. NRRL B-3648 TaxID=1519493 RepID=UPI0006AF201E|nr:DUF6303 family protein [Streptomyces sp. NRRL B-3648]KOV97610.1 hypothetical protein ADL04_15290 [Streptomyces sp. NRRL B-3648]